MPFLSKRVTQFHYTTYARLFIQPAILRVWFWGLALVSYPLELDRDPGGLSSKIVETGTDEAQSRGPALLPLDIAQEVKPRSPPFLSNDNKLAAVLWMPVLIGGLNSLSWTKGILKPLEARGRSGCSPG